MELTNNGSALIKNTTKEERERIVAASLAVATIECCEPSDEVLGYFQLYVDGKNELEEVIQLIEESTRKLIDEYNK